MMYMTILRLLMVKRNKCDMYYSSLRQRPMKISVLLMVQRPPGATLSSSSAGSGVYKGQVTVSMTWPFGSL